MEAKLASILVKAQDTFNITRADNGFIVEVAGKDTNGEWRTVKFVVPSVSDIVTLLIEYSLMEKEL